MVTIAGIAAGMRNTGAIFLSWQTLVLLREGFLKYFCSILLFSIYFCLHFPFKFWISLQIVIVWYIRRYFFQDRFLLCIPQKSRRTSLAGKPWVGHCSTFGFSLLCYRPLFTSVVIVAPTAFATRSLFSSLWLIPVFLFPKRIKIIAAVIGVVLWAASLAALCYYVIYGQEFSQ